VDLFGLPGGVTSGDKILKKQPIGYIGTDICIAQTTVGCKNVYSHGDGGIIIISLLCLEVGSC
jgi:hypothetical protein